MTTELSLRRRGMEFYYSNGIPSVRGQSKLIAAMREEIARREKLFHDAYEPHTIVRITTKPIPRFGHCMTCGDEMESHKSGMCYLCISAWKKVVAKKRADK
jgi:hypothetical protein